MDFKKGLFIYGMTPVRDIPSAIRLTLKGEEPSVVFAIDAGHGVIMAPGEPFTYVTLFDVPDDQPTASEQTQGIESRRRYRLKTLIPWERIREVNFEYPPLEQTDPSVWQRQTTEADNVVASTSGGSVH